MARVDGESAILTAVVTVFMALNLHRKLTAEESHIILQSQKAAKNSINL